MKIELKYPYNTKWKYGYVYVNGDNRKTLILYNNHNERSSTTYSRYLMSVKEKRFLEQWEHVDHKNNDKTDDREDNLQILTKSENSEKYEKEVNSGTFVKIECPNCFSIFIKRKGITQLVPSLKNKITCCSRKCSSEIKKMKLNPEEKKILSDKSILEVFNA